MTPEDVSDPDIASPKPNPDGITVRAFREAGGTEDWPVLGDGALTFVPTGSFTESADFAAAIAALPGIDEHPPAIDIRADGVTVRLLTTADDWWGMGRHDIDLARAISGLAREHGLVPDQSGVQSVMPIVISAQDPKPVMSFWQALTGYVPRPDSPDEDLVDPHDRGPGLWFETVAEPRTERNRVHFAVWVPLDQAEARVAAAIAAGGTLLYDAWAPAWWTLADPEGNEADIATSQGRDEG